MENASKNAKEIFDKITLQYNKARQARITTELVEIISGAVALWLVSHTVSPLYLFQKDITYLNHSIK